MGNLLNNINKGVLKQDPRSTVEASQNFDLVKNK